MRKSLLIATLALGTAAWAQTSGINPAERQDLNQNQAAIQELHGDTGLKSYDARLAPHVDEWIRINQSVSPAKTQFLAFLDVNPVANAGLTPNGEPGSMAASAGQQNEGSDWYNQTVQTAAKYNRRVEFAIGHNPMSAAEE